MNPTKTYTYDEMLLQMGHALSQCQIIEQWIKYYIQLSFRIIRRHVPREFVFNFSHEDYDDASLGVLLTVFRKLNSNAALHADLKEIKKERDFLAHRAATDISETGMSDDKEAMARLFERLVSLEDRANRLFHAVGDEVDKLREEAYKDGKGA